MKTRALFFVALLLASVWTFANNYTIISGKITNPMDDEVSVTIVTDLLSQEKMILSTPLNESGEFVLAFTPSVPMLVRFEHMYENMQIYVSPAQQMSMSFEADKMWKTMTFEGDGAANNNYLVQYHNKFDKEVDETYIEMQGKLMTVGAFKNYIDRQRDEKQTFFRRYTFQNKLTDGFGKIAQGDIHYNWAYDRLRFAESQEWNVYRSYYGFLDQIAIHDEDMIASNTYIHFLMSYLDYTYEREKHDGILSGATCPSARKYELANRDLRSNVLYYTQAQLLLNAVKKEPIHSMMNTYEHFTANSPYQSYNRMVGIAYENAIKFAEGSPAPEFMLTDVNGATVQLSDFKGKVVYLAFWASWCGPCLQQIKYHKALKENLDNDEMVFLYVSIDEDEKAWKNMIDKKEIEGVHVRTPGIRTPICYDYNIAGIPVYFLIDQDGNFTAKPPLASNKEAFLDAVTPLLTAR